MQKQILERHANGKKSGFGRSDISTEAIRRSREYVGFLNYARLVAADCGLGQGKGCGSAFARMGPGDAAKLLSEWHKRGWTDKVSNALCGIEDSSKAAEILVKWAALDKNEAIEALVYSKLFLTERSIVSISPDEFLDKLGQLSEQKNGIRILVNSLVQSDGFSHGSELSRQNEMGGREDFVPAEDGSHWVPAWVEHHVGYKVRYEKFSQSNWGERERAYKALLQEPASLVIPLVIETLNWKGLGKEGVGRCIRLLEELGKRADAGLDKMAIEAAEAAKKRPYDPDLAPKPPVLIGEDEVIEPAE
ncbi:MAG: hypothetical protein QXH30_01510 [Candidatus Bilamarchaeaceae archaeon]